MPLTSSQICTQARSVAKVPGFTTQSGQCLNLTLQELVQKHNLKMNRVTATVSASAGTNGPFDLEANYLRTYDLFYLVDSEPYFLNPASMEMFDAQYKDPSVSNYPYLYATDIQPQAETPDTGLPLLYIYPQSSAALSLTHRYMVKRDDITAPESSSSIPWMPDQDLLIHATARRLMKLSDDSRQNDFYMQEKEMLRDYLIIEGDEGAVVHAVKLDPWRFRFGGRLKPTKTQPW